ncbi:MAG: hypothetical protein QM490_05455 [Candidatus Gracilibacteria bacterium]
MRKRLFIAKAEWFSRRKYTGWGLSVKSWQGIVYILAMVAIIALSGQPYFTELTNMYSIYLGMLVILFFVLDIFYVMYVIYNDQIDERERLHEAISERNALWGIITVLSLGIIYQYYYSSAVGIGSVDPVIVIALFVGLTIKALSNYKLGKNN